MNDKNVIIHTEHLQISLWFLQPINLSLEIRKVNQKLQAIE